MVVKNILNDSFNEFIIALKNVKLTLITLTVIIINLVFQSYQANNSDLMYLFLLPMMIIGSLANVYLYITMPKLISTKEKNMIKFFEMENISYGTTLVKLIISLLKLILVSIGVIVSSGIIIAIIGIIVDKIFSFSKAMSIVAGSIIGIIIVVFFIVGIVRTYLFIPLVVLGNVDKPLNYCWELSKGKFWKLVLIMLFSIVFTLSILLLSMILKNSPFIFFIISIPLNLIILYITTLVSINSLYYFMNKDSIEDIKESSNFETVK